MLVGLANIGRVNALCPGPDPIDVVFRVFYSTLNFDPIKVIQIVVFSVTDRLKLELRVIYPEYFYRIGSSTHSWVETHRFAGLILIFFSISPD
jgi:hypothetical protein